MKRTIGAVVLLLLVAGIPPGSPQTAAIGDAPWWPEPTLPALQFQEGWNLRIPLELHEGQLVRKGTAVQVHLDLARSMIEGGWPGRDSVPSSFKAYPESVRLVEYDDWNTIRGDVPFRLYDTWLEADQLDSQYEKEQTSAFHGQRNPVITLEWRLPRDLGASDTHRYFAYFDIEQNAGAAQAHRKPAPGLQPQERENLDGMYWVGAGTTFYGYYPHSTTENTMTVFAASDHATNVKVYAGMSSTEQLDDRTDKLGPNPEFCLLCPENPGRTQGYSFGFNPTHFRVESDQPIVAMTHRLQSVSPGPDTTPVPEFVPSREGSTLGWTFDVPEVTGSVFVIKPPGGKAQISLAGAPIANHNCPTSSQMGHPVQLTFCRVNLNINANNQNVANTRTITATGDPIMVQFLPRATTGHPAQVPSATGSPVGFTFHAATISDNCRNGASGGFQLTVWERDAFVDIEDRTTNPATSIRQDVQIASEPPTPQRVPGNGLRIQNCPPTPTPPTWNTPLPYTTEAVADPDTGGATGPLQLRAGQFGDGPIAQTTPFGGRHGTDFHVQGPFVIYNYYATTALEITKHTGASAGTEQRTAGPRGTPVVYTLDRNDVTSITADKPISVFPFGTPTNYARFHAAKPAFIEPDILPGEYRGYLFDLMPQDGVDPVFVTALPGQELDSTFQVRNLARWDSQTLSDTVRFSAKVESRNWEGAASVGVDFDQPTMVLNEAGLRNNRITIDLPPDVPSDTQITVRVTAASQGNPQMTQSFSVVVLVRQTFDVDMWFGEPTSVSGPGTKVLRLLEGGQEAIPFVIKNKGSGVDDFDLTLGAPGGGWDAWITDLAGAPLARTKGIEPGKQVGAILHVRAPLTLEAGVDIPIDAVSTTSPLASKRINVDAGIALEVGMRLEAESFTKDIAPGATERFLVTLVNTGDDMVTLCPSLEGELPGGWSLGFADELCTQDSPIGVHPCGDNDPPSKCRLTMEIDLTAPEDAVANDFVSFLLRAEALGEGVHARGAISLSATVSRAHELTIGPLPSLDVVPGQPARLDVTVHNDGNGADSVHIGPASVPGGWIVAPTDKTVIEPGASATFTVQVEAPADAPPGPVEMHLAARSEGPAFPFPLTADVQQIHKFAWRDQDPILTQPGDLVAVRLFLENRGNVPERISLQATAPWHVRLGQTQIELPAGSTRTVELDWETDGEADEHTIHVTARAESGSTQQADLPVRVVVPRLDADEVMQTHAARGHGSVGTVMAVLHNPGDVPVRDAEVRLVGQDTLHDKVQFRSIGPDSTVVAPLRWTDDPQHNPERIEWGHWSKGEFRVLGSAPMPTYVAQDDRDAPLTPLVALIALTAVALRRRGGAP